MSSITSNSNKIRNPDRTDREIIDLLKKEARPMRFQEIAVRLKYSSGKLQTALKRLYKNKKIVKKKVPKDGGKGLVTKIFLEDFNTDRLIPILLNETTANIIEKVPEVSPEFASIDELMKEALVYYFQREIKPEIKIKAIEKAIQDGLISKEKGDKLLGR